MQELYDELRILRERIEELDRRLESRVQDDAGAASSKPDILRYIKFPLGGIGGGQQAFVDWLSGGGWQTGKSQILVMYRGPAATTVGQGKDPRTNDNRTGYAVWSQISGYWEVIQEFC
ncbi:hypothetical protein UFOVP124_54 [uncultured Caudovirales phage]|uniref:Uncharacterized protein n=1 Tax=uncultured Caudovirales phage TaxID=2100421 RepID=A0A6J5LHH0_9CAUD|nr:hypothetical protein UFOVP124_54 [uncultured Caudovirales phage]